MNGPTANLVVIIGNADDVHAASVTAAIGCRSSVVLLDASNLHLGNWRWSDGLEVQNRGCWQHPRRGWLRRLAPPGWHHGTAIGSLGGVEAQATLLAMSAMADQATRTEWLTTYPAMMRAENKLVQYAEAQRIGLPVPQCRVATRANDLIGLGNPLVMKPLGLGAYTLEGAAFAIHARLVDLADPVLASLHIAPYLAQRCITATIHLRIPTVAGRSWPCQLDATGLPLDWRANDAAHTSWLTTDAFALVGSRASNLAAALELGYSCQDWIVDEDGEAWLVDVNPAGQWLFLPPPVAHAVTDAIADWLVGDS